MITSPQNPKIQEVRALQARARARREAQAFVVEGVRLAEEAADAGRTPHLVLYTGELGARARAVLAHFEALEAPVYVVNDRVMRAAADTQSPQGLLAVLPIEPTPIPHPLEFALIVDSVRDPGNLGTILRTAAAAGVQAVFLPPGSVDPYAPKVVRAAMGAHFRLALARLAWEAISDHLAPAGDPAAVRIYLASAGAGQPYTAVDFRGPLAFIVGGEAAGASAAAQALAHAQVHIPMPGGGESLNVSIATGILLFEAQRQRAHL